MGELLKYKNAVPDSGYGNRLSMYLIALEAWRRGINVTFYKRDNIDNKMYIRYNLSNNGKTHFFESSRGDLLTEQAFELCDKKDLTKEKLTEAGVPVPKGKKFGKESTIQEIIYYVENEIGYPV